MLEIYSRISLYHKVFIDLFIDHRNMTKLLYKCLVFYLMPELNNFDPIHLSERKCDFWQKRRELKTDASKKKAQYIDSVMSLMTKEKY